MLGMMLLWWSWCRDLDNDVGGFTHHLGLEALLGIGRVGDGPNETVRINDRVAALDHVSVSRFLTILVVGELIVFNVEAKLVGRILLGRRRDGQY